MLTNFISDAANSMRRPVLRSAETETFERETESAIRINIRSVSMEQPSKEFYEHARNIYYRARKVNRLSRAAGIF